VTPHSPRPTAPALLSIQGRPGHQPLRTYRYSCGHERQTALLTPPKQCPSCLEARYARDNEEAQRRRLLVLMARRARDEAENAHNYRKPHLICSYCVASLNVNVSWFCAGQANIFNEPKTPRGFR